MYEDGEEVQEFEEVDIHALSEEELEQLERDMKDEIQRGLQEGHIS